jgi:hypothetical protein
VLDGGNVEEMRIVLVCQEPVHLPPQGVIAAARRGQIRPSIGWKQRGRGVKDLRDATTRRLGHHGVLEV